MADVKQVESIGTVKTVVGTVKAVDQSGAERILQAGDKVYANETVVTADGGLVLIEFADGSHLDLASASQIILDSDVFNPANAKGEELTAEQIQEMIARGEDPTAVTEATAAGAGSGDEGSSSFIDVRFNNAQGGVGSGFETAGIPGPASIVFTEQPPAEEGAALVVALKEASVEEVPEVEILVKETLMQEALMESPKDEAPEEEAEEGKGNNGFGNGDQDAPGDSGSNNNAENATAEEEESGDEGKGNNGFGNGNQDAPGDSGSNNNAENATAEEEESGDEGKGNNGFGNGDQDAPGDSGSNNNAENAADEEEEPSEEGKGNNGFGNGDQDAPGDSGPNNNAENAADESDVIGTKGNDILTGSDGDDILMGGAGDDILTGGTGADEFFWEKGDLKDTESGDTITDFNVSEGDTLNVDDLLASTKGGTLGLDDDGTNTTVTITTGNTTVELVTLTGVTGQSLDTLLGTTQD